MARMHMLGNSTVKASIISLQAATGILRFGSSFFRTQHPPEDESAYDILRWLIRYTFGVDVIDDGFLAPRSLLFAEVMQHLHRGMLA